MPFLPIRSRAAGCIAALAVLMAIRATGNELALAVRPSDAKDLATGRAFARVVSSADPSEVVTIAGVRIAASVDAMARCAMTPGCLRRREESSSGRLASIPTSADFLSLRLDSRDLDELRRCKVGQCDVRLPRETIETFGRQIDWSSPHASASAEAAFRAFLEHRATIYSTGGHRALPPYADRSEGADVAGGMDLLLSRPLPGLDAAADVRIYLAGPPVGLATLGDEYLVWHRERVYRKFVVSLEHVVVTRRDDADTQRVLVVSKKFYSSHYFEASMEVAEFSRRRTEAQGQFVIAVRSRTDIRRSGFSWIERLLLRRMVSGRIVSELEDLRARLSEGSERLAELGTERASR